MSETTNSDNVAQEEEILKTFIGGLMEHMGIPGGISTEEAEDRLWVELKCEEEEDTERLIARKGQAIDAIQHLAGKKLARIRDDKGLPVMVDAGGFRQSHIDKLEEFAVKMKDKCESDGESVKLKPMNAFDRRVVHMALADDDAVRTESEGEGRDRHVVVHLKNDE